MDLNLLLYQSEFLKGISERSRKLLANICILKTINKKESIFLEGNKGYSIYICVTGKIQLYKSSKDGKEIVIKVIKPGEMFGEVILFEVDKYPVSTIALVNSKVLLIPKHQFHCLLNQEDFRNDFIAMLMKKQRYLADQIKYLTVQDVEERLFSFLREQFGTKEKIIPSMTKKDMAAAIGTTPETFSRLLLRLKSENKLFWEGKTIVIQNPCRNRHVKDIK